MILLAFIRLQALHPWSPIIYKCNKTFTDLQSLRGRESERLEIAGDLFPLLSLAVRGDKVMAVLQSTRHRLAVRLQAS